MGRSGLPSKTGYMGLWAHPSPYPNRHLDRFGRLCWAYDRDRQTGRQTMLLPSVTIGHIYIVLQCGLKSSGDNFADTLNRLCCNDNVVRSRKILQN